MLLAVREGAKTAEAKRRELPKAADKAYSVRRLRTRAGTVVAPGLLFGFRFVVPPAVCSDCDALAS